MQNKRYIGIFMALVCAISMAYVTRNLEQANNDELFLDKKGLQNYHVFKKLIPEKNILLATKFTNIKKDTFTDFKNLIKKYEKNYPKIKFLDFSKVYKINGESSEYERTLQFYQKHKDILHMPLFGDNRIGFLAIWEKDRPDFVKEIVKEKDLSFSGLPYVNYLLNFYSSKIKEVIFPVVFIVAFLLTLIITREFSIAAFLYLPCLTSFFLTLYFIQILFGDMNLVTSIVPLLIFVITLSLSFHIFFSYSLNLSIKDSLKEKRSHILMTIFTTTVGFGALYLSPIVVIQQFSLICVLSLFVCSIFVIFFFYFFLDGKVHEIPFVEKGKLFFKKSFDRHTIFFLCTASFILSIVILPKVGLLTNAVNFFPKDGKGRTDIIKMSKAGLGLPLYEIVFEKKETFEYKDLLNFEKMENKIKGVFSDYQLYSLNTFVKEANAIYSDQDKLPPMPISFFTLRGQLPPLLLESYPYGNIYRMTLFGPALEAMEYKEKLEKLRFLIGHEYKYQVNGLYYNLMQTHGLLIKVLSKSFLLSLVIISLMSILFFKDYKIFFIFIIINIIPISFALIFMYFTGVTINVASVMTFSISLGLIVDSSFHYVFVLKKKIPYNTYYQTTIIPIFASSVLLVLSVGILGFDGFIPIRHFGVTLSFTLLIGMIFDLYVLPTLIEGRNVRK